MLSTSTAAGIVGGHSKGKTNMARKIVITSACLIKGEHTEAGSVLEFGEGATLSEAEGFTLLASSRGREIAEDEAASVTQRAPRGRRSDAAA